MPNKEKVWDMTWLKKSSEIWIIVCNSNVSQYLQPINIFKHFNYFIHNCIWYGPIFSLLKHFMYIQNNIAYSSRYDHTFESFCITILQVNRHDPKVFKLLLFSICTFMLICNNTCTCSLCFVCLVLKTFTINIFHDKMSCIILISKLLPPFWHRFWKCGSNIF